jgi:hypothetical protein
MSFAANPRAPGNPPSKDDVPQESTGPVASDSLAAESLKSGGDFAEGDAVPLSQKGSGSTFNTTDTSGATTLHPAASGATREKQDAMGLGSDEKGAAGVKYPDAAGTPQFTGTHNLDGYAGGPSSDKTSSGYTTQPAGASDFGATTTTSSSSGTESATQIKSSANTDQPPGTITPSDQTSTGTSGATGPSAGTGVRPAVDNAPTYAARVSGAISNEDELKPKGTNLTEGDIPQTKTFTGDVGGQHDPGRAAEQGFEKITAGAGQGGGMRGGEGGGEKTGENPFGVLGSERA